MSGKYLRFFIFD